VPGAAPGYAPRSFTGSLSRSGACFVYAYNGYGSLSRIETYGLWVVPLLLLLVPLVDKRIMVPWLLALEFQLGNELVGVYTMASSLTCLRTGHNQGSGKEPIMRRSAVLNDY